MGTNENAYSPIMTFVYEGIEVCISFNKKKMETKTKKLKSKFEVFLFE